MAAENGYAACVPWTETITISSVGTTTMCYNVTTIEDSGLDGIIRLDANNIILDCNGSIIYGNYLSSSIGIQKTFGNGNNVILKNCTFYGYTYGIYMSSVDNIIIQDSNFSSNTHNIYFSGVNNSEILDTTINGASDCGAYLLNSKNITFKNNTIAQNTQSGIYLSGTTDSWIDGNDIVDNGDGTNSQIFLTSLSLNNNITDNFFSGSNGVANWAININSGSFNLIRNNEILFTGNGGLDNGGIKSNYESNTIKNNTIQNAKGVGIKIENAASNIIDENTITDSITYGIYVDNTLVLPSNMTNNFIKGAGTAGIYLIDTSDSTKIYNNTITNTSLKTLGYGISISGDARYNNISYNDISYATNNGLYFSNFPRNNQIYYNFLRNSIQDDFKIETIASATDNNISLNALTKNFTYPTGSGNNILDNILANLIVDNDTNPIRDYSNITDAVGAAVAGSKIFVYDGYYKESINLTNDNMTLVGETKENTSVNCSNGNYAFKIESNNNITIDNFTIECIYPGRGIWIENTNYTNVFNSIIRNNGYGIFLLSAYYNTLKDILFKNNYQGLALFSTEDNNITKNNFSTSIMHDINIGSDALSNNIWKNKFTSTTNIYDGGDNSYCINGWDNWYTDSLSTNPECFADFTAEWNDLIIYVNDTVRLIVNLTGETEIAQLNATIYWNGTAANYSLESYSGNNITGQWSYVFNDTEFLGSYLLVELHRKDADADVGSHDLITVFDTKILEMNTSLDKTNENINQPINIFVNVSNNASAIENVTTYILKPDGYLEVKELALQKIISGIYYYSLKYENTSRSGEYDINITAYAKNTVTENQSFTINYGWPYIQLIEGNTKYENNTNYTRRYGIYAIGGDLRNVTASLFINSSVLEFNSDINEKNKSNIYLESTDGWEVEWNITTINTGTSYVNLTIANSTILSPNGYYNERNTTVNISVGGSDTEDPAIKNLWVENDYTTYNLNETVIIYANISDNFGVKSAFLNITHPTGFSENIAGERVETYEDDVVKFRFNAENITTITTTTPYIFYTNASDYSENTNISTTENFNTTDQYSVGITIYDIYNRGEWVNVTLDVLNVNSLSVSGFSETISLNDTEGNKSILQDGTYFITATNKTGLYSIYANVSKYKNAGNATKEFNITDKLIASVFAPPLTYNPTREDPLTITFRISTARGEAYLYDANFTASCYLTRGGFWGSNNNTEGTYIGSNITWSQYDEYCFAAPTAGTQFNITFNISDDPYNNTGIDTHFRTTKSESTTPSGGDDTITTSPYIGGDILMPTTTEKENITDFDFSIKPEKLMIIQGTQERTFLVLNNIGDMKLELNITIKKECCEINTNSSITVEPKNKVSVPLDIYANLTIEPNEYHTTITAEKGALEKTETLIVVIEENPSLGSLRNLKEQSNSLKQTIAQYKTAGVNTENLEKMYETLTTILLKAQTAINNDDLEALNAEIAKAKVEKAKLEAEILGLKTILWLNEYKEELIVGIVSSLIIFLFTTKFLIPYLWMKKELMHLRKKERKLAEVRKATEIQYFKRQIDEATFNKIMADKQSAINDAKIEIRGLETSISLLKRGKFSKIEGIEKYKVSGKLKQNMNGFTVMIKKPFAKKENTIHEKKIEEFSFTPKKSNILKDTSRSSKGSIAKILRKYHNWKIKKQERKLVHEIDSLETEETKLENEESKIKRAINELKKEKEELENSEK